MSLTRKHIGWLGVGALWAIVSGLPAMADDTELFRFTPSASVAGRPNILFILDDSGSMANLVTTQVPYSSSINFSGSCSTSRIYWQTGTGGPPSCSSNNNYVNTSAFMCNAGNQALAAAGFFTDMMAQYNDNSGTRRWETIAGGQNSRLVECEDDWGLHGRGGSGVYPRNGQSNATDAWQSGTSGAIAWGSSPTSTTYTVYSGNYLNWLSSPTVQMTRLAVVQNVTTNLLQSINGVNVGLMHFNNDQGGRVSRAMEDIGTARTPTIAAVNALTASNWTPLSETLYEATMYYMGRQWLYGNPTVGGGLGSVATSRMASPNTNTYKTPIELGCQKNFVVYLTDGEPTQDTDAEARIRALTDANGAPFSQFVPGGVCDAEAFGAHGVCLDDLAQFLNQADLSTQPGRQNVTTHTIGFTINLPILQKTATKGGGVYYTANDTATLANALQNIVTSILEVSGTFVAPAVSVNTFNRTQNVNELYLSLFKPTGTAHWPGNLKKYQLRAADGAILDANGNVATNPLTGFFNDTARSFWSAAVDGADIAAGGAASRLPAPAARNVYTHLGNAALTDPSNRVAKTNAAITDAMLRTGLPGDPTRDNVIDFINGLDLPDTNQNGITNEARNQMGDPLHSSPVSVVYGPTVNDATVYVATNNGYLHAIDARNGVERWAFIPPPFLRDQIALYKNNATPNKQYGIDGSLRVQILADNDGVISPGEKVYLYFGVRSGGDMYYGLDITNPAAPRLMWSKDNLSLPGVGQTWSTPVPTRMNIQGAAQNADKFVLVFGGGYEADQDSPNTSIDVTGNAIYVIDSVSGALLWHGSKLAGNKMFNTLGKAMDYSIPAEIKVVDFDGDGYADRLYASDMGGQVWRFDVNNGQPASGLVNGGVIAQLGAAGTVLPTVAQTRRFYYSPDVALVNTREYNFIHVGIGSGHRAHPLNLGNQDRFYALRDYSGQGKLTQAQYDALPVIMDTNLVDITDNPAATNATVPQGSAGWRFELRDGGWRGEKVLADARTFNNQVFFTTFRPSSTATGCEPQLGTKRLYIMNLFNGSPVTNLDGSADPTNLTATDRFREFQGAPASEVVFIFPSPDLVDADGDGIPDPCVGDQCTPPPIACVDLFCFPPGFSNNPIRTFWSQESTD